MTWQARLQNIKYLANDLEQHCGHENLTFPNLTLFTDPTRTPDPAALAEILPTGCGLIYRHFGSDDRIQVATRLRAITSARQIAFLIGNDIALYQYVRADGVHFSENGLSAAKDFRTTYPKALASIACHNMAALSQIEATSLAFDAVFISPIFASQSPSAQNKEPLGLSGIAQMIAATALPIYGLGGINTNTIDNLKGTGLCGVAGIELFLN